MADQTDNGDPRDPADEPGRPLGKDEIDPELLALPRPRTRIGPVLAISVVVLCGYLMSVLRHDLAFSREPIDPRTTTLAEVLASGDTETHVQLRAIPDRTLALHASHSQADPGHRMTPVQGTQGRLWIMIPGSVWQSRLGYEELYSGRLRAVADLPFGDDLRRYVAEQPPAPRFVPTARVVAALQGQDATLTEPGGDTITLADVAAVHAYETVADRARVQAYPTDQHATAAAWTKALLDLGLTALDVPRNPDEEGPWTFVATLPGGVEAMTARLTTAGLRSAQVEPVKQVHDTTWSGLLAQGGRLVVDGRQVPWDSVSWLALDVTREVPADAVVLLTDESPDHYWYVLPLFAFLGLAGLLFSWAFVRAVIRELADRTDRPAAADQAAPDPAAT